MLREKRGITLVALVVTIIVLLILAGISITTIVGDDGVIMRAQKSAEETKKNSAYESIDLVISEWKTEELVGEKTLKEYLDSKVAIGSLDSIVKNEETGCYELYKDGYFRTVNYCLPYVGQYVEYKVSYEDVYTGKTYTSQNGWRYIGEDEDGNHKIISATIPLMLHYSSSQNAGVDNNGWWGTDEEVTETYNASYITNGYIYSEGGHPNRYAATGLLTKFESIPYEQVTTGTQATTPNTLIGRMASTEGNGTIGETLEASDIKSKIINVRTLTEEEIDEIEPRTQWNLQPIITDANRLGLIFLTDLPDGYASSWYYWLASPEFRDTDARQHLEFANGSGYLGYSANSNCLGIRPVIVLSKDVTFSDVNKDGILEMK